MRKMRKLGKKWQNLYGNIYLPKKHQICLKQKDFFFVFLKKKEEENNFGICQDNRNMTNLGYLSVVRVQQKVVCRCVIWIASPRRIQKTLAKHGTNVELTMIMANA